jgi:DNA-binding response OmpR family regulator
MEMSELTSTHLLIVDTDETARTGLLLHFRSRGYTVTTASDATTALGLLQKEPGYDVAILGLSLEASSGFDLLDTLRDSSIDTRLLVLSEHSDLDTRLSCLSLGADDVVLKPFNIEEVYARVQVLLSDRMKTMDASRRAASAFRIDANARTCFCDDTRVPLTAREFEVLNYLVHRQGEVISRDELRTEIWEKADAIRLRTIDRHVATIRHKLRKSRNAPAYLQTVQGRGYRFTGPELA